MANSRRDSLCLHLKYLKKYEGRTDQFRVTNGPVRVTNRLFSSDEWTNFGWDESRSDESTLESP